jgi:hypothetical protein
VGDGVVKGLESGLRRLSVLVGEESADFWWGYDLSISAEAVFQTCVAVTKKRKKQMQKGDR